jgi:hypothetical protein
MTWNTTTLLIRGIGRPWTVSTPTEPRLLIRGSGTDRAANSAAKRLDASGHRRTALCPPPAGLAHLMVAAAKL